MTPHEKFRINYTKKGYNPSFIEAEIAFMKEKSRMSNDIYFSHHYPDANEFWEVENPVRPIKYV